MKSAIALVFLVALGATFAQEETTVAPPETTANPGLPYGDVCNGIIWKCNRYSETVACLQRRADPTTLPPTTEDPIVSLLLRKPAPQEICETGFGVDLGRCQCSRNCKQGVYVEDGEFDHDREICVGLVGSACSLVVPNCTKDSKCNYVTSKCVCNAGFVELDRRCVAA